MSNFSPRYERFLSGKEAKQYEGRWSQVPFYEGPQKLKFSGKELAQLDAREGWVPLATLGQEEARYFVVKAGDSACPVALWEPETETFTPHAHSLDSFLASLGTTKTTAKGTEAVVGAAALSKIVERGIGLTDGRLTKARRAELEQVLGELEPMMKRLPPSAPLARGEFHGLPSRALFAHGKMLRALGRIEEACAVFENATLEGARVSVAPQLLCEMLLELDQPQRALAVCEASDEVSPLLHVSWALAAFRLQETQVAAEHLSVAVTRQVSAKLKLSPKTDRAAETKVRLAALRETFTAYASKHGLHTKVLQVFAAIRLT